MDKELQKINNFFKDLRFDEPTHKYTVGKEPLKSSVSKLVKLFVKDTDFGQIASSIDKRDKLPMGTTSMRWDLNSKISLAIGTSAHYFGEMYAFHRNLVPVNGYEEGMAQFWKDLPPHIVPATMELRMYHKDHKFAGTGDILLYNTLTGRYIIADYKTNKDLYKNFKGTTMTGIFSHLLDMPFNHYQLQLSFYQLLFEQTGYEVEGRIVIWVKPDGSYEMFDTEDYTKELKDYLKNNKV